MKIDGLAKTRCPISRTVAATPRYVPTENLIIGISQGGHEGFWQVYMVCGLAGEDSIASLKLGGMQEYAVKGARLILSMRQCLDIDHGTTVSGTKLARVTEGQQSRHKTQDTSVCLANVLHVRTSQNVFVLHFGISLQES